MEPSLATPRDAPRLRAVAVLLRPDGEVLGRRPGVGGSLCRGCLGGARRHRTGGALGSPSRTATLPPRPHPSGAQRPAAPQSGYRRGPPALLSPHHGRPAVAASPAGGHAGRDAARGCRPPVTTCEGGGLGGARRLPLVRPGGCPAIDGGGGRVGSVPRPEAAARRHGARRPCAARVRQSGVSGRRRARWPGGARRLPRAGRSLR